jgi:hypothetical protein
LRQTGTASTTSPAMSGSGRPLRGRPTTRRRATRRSMPAVRLAQKTSANRTGELSRAVRTCAHLRTAIATDLRLDKVMAYAAQPVISDFAACSLPSLRVSQRPQGPALDIRSVIFWPTSRSGEGVAALGRWRVPSLCLERGRFEWPRRAHHRQVGLPTQPHARAFAFSWSNSAWVIVPASRSCLADAI